MFAIRQKLLLGGAVLFSVLLLAGIYFGRHWLFGADVEVVTEYVLPDEPLPAQMTRLVRASASAEAPPVFEADSEDESISDEFSTSDSDSTKLDEELETQLAALTDEEFTTLAEALEQEEGKSSKYPDVPEGFPSNIRPVWLEDYFDENLHADPVIMCRVLIELWNQGDHDIVYGVLDENTGRVYPIYHDVVYVEWDSYVREDPNGESREVPYISYKLGISSTVEPLLNDDGNLFTEEDIVSGAYVTMYPDVTFVDYSDAGYDPATILNDY